MVRQNSLDKRLEDRRKERDDDFEHRVVCLNNFWKIAIRHPLTYAVFILLVALGFYCDWQFKEMINRLANWGIPSLITWFVQDKLTHHRGRAE